MQIKILKHGIEEQSPKAIQAQDGQATFTENDLPFLLNTQEVALDTNEETVLNLETKGVE